MSYREIGFASRQRFLGRGYVPSTLPQFSHWPVRRATNSDVATIVQEAVRGQLPLSLYWTTFEYTKYDDNYVLPKSGDLVGRVDYQSANLNNVFVELECQPCGRLCEHTIEEGQHLENWCREQGIVPYIVYSGGKSLHFYLFFEQPKLRTDECQEGQRWPDKVDILRDVSRTIIDYAQLKLADPVVVEKPGLTQMARIPESVNIKTGYKCATLFKVRSVFETIKWAKLRPKIDMLEKCPNLVGGCESELLTKVAQKIANTSVHTRQVYTSVSSSAYTSCPAVMKARSSIPANGTQYWHCLMLTDDCKKRGLTSEQAFEDLLPIMNKWGFNRFRLEATIRDRYSKTDRDIPPCMWLSNVNYSCSLHRPGKRDAKVMY